MVDAEASFNSLADVLNGAYIKVHFDAKYI
jgi:hypothetical protein